MLLPIAEFKPSPGSPKDDNHQLDMSEAWLIHLGDYQPGPEGELVDLEIDSIAAVLRRAFFN